MQDVISIGLNGRDCLKLKKEINKEAAENKMSVSRFFLWLYSEYRRKKTRNKKRRSSWDHSKS